MTTTPDPRAASATAPRAFVVRPTTPADADVLDRLWQLFRHDVSDLSGALPDATGRFRDERLRSALSDPVWRGHLALADGRPAGFALVRDLDAPVRVLSAFFVVRAARRHGLGLRLAVQVLSDLPGRWEVAYQDANEPASAFWPRVVQSVAAGPWTTEHRPVPGRRDLPPDTWAAFRVPPPTTIA